MANLDDVLIFVQVAQFESISQAARSLGMPISTVSRRISVLESKVGVVHLRSNTPSFDSSIDNRRLTVEIGIPNERAAWLMLSNWATWTNIRMSSRVAMGDRSE